MRRSRSTDTINNAHDRETDPECAKCAGAVDNIDGDNEGRGVKDEGRVKGSGGFLRVISPFVCVRRLEGVRRLDKKARRDQVGRVTAMRDPRGAKYVF